MLALAGWMKWMNEKMDEGMNGWKKEETLENQHTLGVDHDISPSLTTALVLPPISHESKQWAHLSPGPRAFISRIASASPLPTFHHPLLYPSRFPRQYHGLATQAAADADTGNLRGPSARKMSVGHSVMSCSLWPHGLYIACQAPLSMEFSRQDYWSGLLFPSPGHLPDPGIDPLSPALASRFLTTSTTWEALYFPVLSPFLYIHPTHASTEIFKS